MAEKFHTFEDYRIALEKKKEKKTKRKKYRILRIIGKFFAGLIILLLLLILFIRSPWGQDIIVNKVVNYVSGKTNTKVAVEKLYVTFGGNVLLKGLYLEDKKGDTLVYSKSLEADIPLLPIIRGNGIAINSLDWEGLRANIIRKDSASGYNFQFLMDAFAAPDSTAVATDTTAAPMDITLGTINLKDFNVVFDDAVLGIDSHFQIGKLNLEMQKADLEKMDFRASEAYITNSKIKYIQSPVPLPTNEPPPLPFLSFDKLAAKNVFVNYKSYADRITANLDLIDFYAEISKADLANNDIEIGDFNLKNSVVKIHSETENNAITEKSKEVVAQTKKDIQTFEWPDLRISIADVNLENNNIGYFVGDAEVEKDIFNPNAIDLKAFNLKANDIFLKDKKAGLRLENLTFEEASGLNLNEMALNLDATDNYFKVDDLVFAMNNNQLKGQLQFDYPSLSEFIETPEKSKISLDLPSFQIDLKEIFKFQPNLKKNEYLAELSRKYLTGNLTASGYLSSIQIPGMNINWGNTTQITASGVIENTTDPNNIYFNIPNFSARTIRTDLLRFIDENQLGVSLPKNVSLKGKVKGDLEDVYANVKLNSSQGIAIIDGHFQNDSKIAFDANVEIQEYKLNELLKNDQLGTLSLSLKTEGTGSTINTLDATLDANISHFKFNGYEIENLPITGNIKNGKGNVVSSYEDENLNLDLNAGVVLDSVAPQVNLDLDVIGANLQSLGIMQRDVRTAMKIDADFEGTTNSYDVIATIGDGVVVYDNKTYLLGDFLATAHVRKDTTSLWLDNKMVQLQLESNTDPATFSSAVQRHVSSYFYRDTKLPDSITNPVQLNLIGKISQSPVLNEVFLVNVKDLDTVKLAVDFDEKARELKADIRAPHINYGGNELDSLAFTMDTDKEKFVFDLGFNELKAGPLDIDKTKITGNQQNNELSLNFTAFHKDSTLINIESKITGHRERLRFHVLPDNLTVNSNPWETPQDNEIIITENNLDFNNFRFNRNNQSVEFSNKAPNVSKDHIAINFKNFELSAFLNYLNPEEKLATGNLNGDFILEEPFGNTGIIADLEINKLNILDVDLGTLSVDAKSLGGNSYDFKMSVKEGAVDLDLTGDYIATTNDAKLDLDLKINEFKMKALEGFSMGAIKNGDGSFSGKFTVSGTRLNPKYEGNLSFNDADFTITQLNAPFTLANENLKIDNEGVYMDHFTVRDENNNTFVVSGEVGTESFVNPTFDLKVKADNFQVLNATEDDNDFLYGKASFNADATITGDLQIPKIDMKATVTNDTDVTYVMPSAAVAIEERDGVVIFVNRENPDAILTQTEQQTATFTGFDINALVNIGKAARVKIIIDEETGDNFEVYGDGDFDFTMNPNGRMNLSGVYEIAGGHYEMNLYNLVSRRFELVDGSRVSWSGDPFNAKLDVKARYDLETSASSLMAPTTSGADPAVKSKFRQVLPFYVYLNVDGELTAPKISFNLDMPEDEQGAIGGQVYGRVQQVNQQEGELNRQVFSLLVLNRFYPEPGSDGSRGGFASVARDNINDALSDQLNTFSNKLLGDTGVELDFGLDSYTDYQGETPQERTQLDIAAQKKLFDDRLIVRVGSEVDIQGSSSTGEATPLIGNVSLEYLLTENGRYRLKGFRRNEFENVIDGQTIVSGIALIFTQEFNKFDELWQAILRGETQQEKEARKAAREEKKQKEKETEKDNQDNKEPKN